MLTVAEHPVAWAMLVYELSDAHEHLGALVAQVRANGAIDEADYAIRLGHVFAHLNRAWHGHDDTRLDEVVGNLHDERSQYPVDLPPIG